MLLILYNSKSGKGKGKKIAETVRNRLIGESIPFEMLEDRKWPDHINNYEAVWLIGGDGTINYYLNRYPDSKVPLAIFPGGTGNDYYSNFHTHHDIGQLITKYLREEIKMVDIGLCNGQRFVNTVGIGFDGEVLKNMSIARWVGGHLGYLLVVIKHLFTYKELNFKYTKHNDSREEKLLLFFISNAPTTGGGFIISPHARVDDDLLQIVTAKPTPVLQRLFLLPRVEKGTHLSHSRVEEWSAKNIKIEMDVETFYQIDGELKSARSFDLKLENEKYTLYI